MTLIMTSEMADQLVVIVIAGMQFLLQNVEIMEHGEKKKCQQSRSCSSIEDMVRGKLGTIK